MGDDGPGEGVYERLITAALHARLERLAARGYRIERERVDPVEVPAVLAQHLGALVRAKFEDIAGDDAAARRIVLANEILGILGRAGGAGDSKPDDELVAGPEQLLEVMAVAADLGARAPTIRPTIPMGSADVLLGDRGEHSAAHVIRAELPSAESVDLLCSFLKWSGYRLVRDALREHVRDRGRRLRVLTTTYVGVTERRVLDDLRALGAEVRVSYEHQRTRLHAKAWIFRRRDDLSTAIVGSSNLTHAALVEGLEWNVRISERVTPDSLEKLARTFDGYWCGDEFETYDTERNGADFDRAIRAASGRGSSSLRLVLELRARSFQQEMLDRIEAARRLHGHHRNLVVAATGTGKTVVAALDFARLRRDNPGWRLLFVAHRREILEQARDTYRHALDDPAFGDLMGDGETARQGASVFAMVQSLHAERLRTADRGAYDVLVLDEFHHAAASSYRELLGHFEPRELLGLTATPERTDGIRIQDEFFGGRITAELRLWDALDRGLLVPFHYFGVADGTDLRGLRWTGGYETAELARVFTGNDVRLRAILRAVSDYVPEASTMRALGFCAGVEHARWMAAQFTAHGLPAIALSGESTHDEREQAIASFRSREGGVRALFTADLFNEGVDLPETDVVLLLRPTDSPVLFQQQLGRGLRRAEAAGKSCLTVLDFVGQNHRRFRMHRRLAVLCGVTARLDVANAVAAEIPSMPPGCAMHLERQAREDILKALREALSAGVVGLTSELRELGPSTRLAEFLDRTGAELDDVYRADRCWSELRRRAGYETRPVTSAEEELASGLGRLLHIDDATRIRFLLRALDPASAVAERDASADLRWQMLEVVLRKRASRGADGRRELHDALMGSDVLREEIRELAEVLRARLERPTFPLAEIPEVPLEVHASYRTREALAALGEGERARIDQGVFHLPAVRADAFFVELVKSQTDYSPTTLYRDHAVSPDLFHWQSQSTTSDSSATARRYFEHRERGHQILLFVRERRAVRGVTQPYVFLGAADYVSHEGSRPVSILWHLRRPMPPALYRQAALVRATA